MSNASQQSPPREAVPFLRWAGSKRWLAPQILRKVPPGTRRYIEPFLGSGAVYFGLPVEVKAVVSDTLSPLISCYTAVREMPDEVSDRLMDWKTDSESYYLIRSMEVAGDEVAAAARFIYLNRLCFNGLYRVNSSGTFNVPYGRPKNSNMVSRDELRAASQRLRSNTVIEVADFAESLECCGSDDFVYLDPPYVAGHRNNGFVDYNAKLFTWEDQERLAKLARKAVAKGAYVVISNADHSSVTDLYQDMPIERVTRHSSMAASAGKRGPTSEILVTMVQR